MPDFSTWLTANIPDPSDFQHSELYLALSALNTVINTLGNSPGTLFTYDAFYSSAVTTVLGALQEIGEALESSALGRKSVTIPSNKAALVDATDVYSFLVDKTGVLGIAYGYLETAPAATPGILQILKNAATMYELSVPVGVKGPLELDLSFISVIAGDVITLKCVDANGMVGLMFTMEY